MKTLACQKAIAFSLLLILLFSLSIETAYSAEQEVVRVDQVYADLPEMQVYFHLLDKNGEVVTRTVSESKAVGLRGGALCLYRIQQEPFGHFETRLCPGGAISVPWRAGPVVRCVCHCRHTVPNDHRRSAGRGSGTQGKGLSQGTVCVGSKAAEKCGKGDSERTERACRKSNRIGGGI